MTVTWLVSDVPLQVCEALVCAVALLLFYRDIPAVAGLFSEVRRYVTVT